MNSLLIIEPLIGVSAETMKKLPDIKKNFFGKIYNSIDEFPQQELLPNSLVYICGDIEAIFTEVTNINSKYLIVKELSHNFCETSKYNIISIGEIPINVHNVGVYFKNIFNPDINIFNELEIAHTFSGLTESNKPFGNSFRKGVYLTKVDKTESGEYHFNLLRCSTNFRTPTENFKSIDNMIVEKVNKLSHPNFPGSFEMNHVLAQMYINTYEDNKEKKGKISVHSDKTKDMPSNGLMGFCSFYKNYINGTFVNMHPNVRQSTTDPYDYCYNDISVLTKLRFRLKQTATDPTLVPQFDVVLYPNSVFVISLFTNRMYTHEIIPSSLPPNIIPTRIGYVIRSSKTKAVFKNNHTYIENNGKLIKLNPNPTDEEFQYVKSKYTSENTSCDIIDYGDVFFSMNQGDYMQPIV